MKTIKISELPLYQSLRGLFTIATDRHNNSVKVPLEDLMFDGEVDPFQQEQADWNETNTEDPTYIKNKPEHVVGGVKIGESGSVVRPNSSGVATLNVTANAVTMNDGRSVETGKATLLAEAGFLTPSHFPKLMLYNVAPFDSEPDYSAIPVGSVYLDDSLTAPYKRLYYKKTVEGLTQRIDLGAPQDCVVYCHQSTGKLYRWVSTNNGNDGSFQQVGGDGTITAVQFTGESAINPGQDGIVHLGTIIRQHQDISGKANITDVQTAINNVTPTISQNGKWVIGGVETDVDAQGPQGNSILVNENAQGIQALIVNNVVDGGETDILSAEMGKVIRIAVMTIFNALSPYAFTNGKPIISWGSTAIKHDISVNGVTGGLTISDIYVDNESVAEMPLQILDNKSLSFKLNLPNDAYIFNGVAITMGGIEITENLGVWDETTGIVTIANVTGAVVVVATASTYVQDSLVFNLDCRQGVTLDANDVPIKWTDQKGNIEFDLTGVTQNSAGALVFNGSAKGIAASGSLVAPFDNCTVEVIGTMQLPQNAGDNMPILANNNGGSAAAGFGRSGPQYNAPYFSVAASPLTGVSQNPYNTAFYYGGGGNIAIAATKTDVLFDGILQNDPWHHHQSAAITLDLNDYTAGKSDLLSIGYRVHSATPAEKFLNGTIMAIRIHTRKLSVVEMQTNYAIDKERFNLQ